MRRRLATEQLVEEILDFGASQLFRGAVNYTCVLVLGRDGVPELAYRRIRGTGDEVLEELAAVDRVPAQRFAAADLGEEPWVLVPPEEAAVIRVARRDAVRLEEATKQIFQGLITGADDVYVLDARGKRAGRQVVYSEASGRELELEPHLLYPLASGSDVDPYAFRPLRSLVLFPYVEDGGARRLARLDELEALPRTLEYLREHELRLRARERRRMDHDDRWWSFSRKQNLDAHELPKLGVAATVRNLEVGADLAGEVCFHNVRVNGILGLDGGMTLPALLVLLNSRLLDWIFRRGAGVHANDYYAANKQFIAGLPIRLPEGAAASELHELGLQLHERARGIGEEREGFLRWLAGTLRVSRSALPGERVLARPEALIGAELQDVLDRARGRLGVDPRERALRDIVEREHRASSDRLAQLVAELESQRRRADALVYELYELPEQMRRLVDTEYVQ